MYSRKQFFIEAAKRCLDFIKSSNSILTKREDVPAKESYELNPQSLFFEAMRLGIDPGTLDMRQLLRAVNDAREQH